MFAIMYNHKAAKTAFWFLFIGFNTLYFPMFIMGWLGMPRRYYDYLPEFHIYHFISTIGSWILITGLIIMFTNLIRSLRKGEVVTEQNIWGGETLEWQIPTPPPTENFEHIPTITTGPYEYKQNEEPEMEEVK
jgi:cytochrome c oxidase subunit 1